MKASGAVDTYSQGRADCGIVARKNIPVEAVVGGGDYFTLGAILAYPEFLCPDGWAVPSLDDYNALNLAFGGTGDLTVSQSDATISIKYVDEWGAIYAGNTANTGNIQNHFTSNLSGNYWTNTAPGADRSMAYAFQVGNTMRVFSQNGSFGYNIRCVKEAPAAE